MPSIRASARANIAGWKPLQNTIVSTPQTRPTATQSEAITRSPFMQASMPLMASTNDAFTRQFYSSQNIPQQRILPAKKGAGT